LDLKDIYRPICGELAQVERDLLSLSSSAFPPISPFLEHILSYRGKHIRPAITLLVGKLLGFNPELHLRMAMAVELFHTATLIHDDIVDNSPLRRGKPTPNSLWGRGTALLLGDRLFAQAASLVAATGNVRVIQAFAQTLITVSDGELEHNLGHWEKKLSREHYFRWIRAKTASVFSLAALAGAVLSGAGDEQVAAMENYGSYLGLAFQIVDDILDFMGEEREMGKPVGSDLLQGVPTLPAIIYVEQCSSPAALKAVLDKESELAELVKKIVVSPAIEESYKIARELASRARDSLTGFPPHPALESLARLVDYTILRRW